MNIYSFSDSQSFTQAAFNRVAELVSQNGQCALDNFVPAKQITNNKSQNKTKDC